MSGLVLVHDVVLYVQVQHLHGVVVMLLLDVLHLLGLLMVMVGLMMGVHRELMRVVEMVHYDDSSLCCG